ncbi:Uncharacterised protein [Nocardia otitidiscaviarum]|uniref:Uncharacterized protein n=1 Tax=Nocardia otitidiscaviarum TaxID=1823 RepID=A0A379JG72_9NOCA|nr:hypothetical protein [Nocardia otitidiscaviarum]MBF6177294.1 hypothetical protein [Nocardia otitidiscaviarum]SUD47434.1 Uncharacterised protein [Nocardia otitidiscaviarum]
MIPTRTTFATWDIAGLQAAATTTNSSGNTLEVATHELQRNCENLPEMRGWEGKAHDAATTMFTRTSRQGRFFNDVALAMAAVQANAGQTFSSLKTRLDNAVTMIESGPLFVNDLWVVLLKPEPMDDERYKALQNAQKAMQTNVINPLLVEFDAADKDLVHRVFTVASKYTSIPLSIAQLVPKPDSGVPVPNTEDGLARQEQIQKQDAATTVRDTQEQEWYGNTKTTITMQDGSKHVVVSIGSIEDTSGYSPERYSYNELGLPMGSDGLPLGSPPTGWSYQVETVYDPSGKVVATTSTKTDPTSGYKTTESVITDQSRTVLWQDADGRRGGTVTDLTTGTTTPIPEPIIDRSLNMPTTADLTHPVLTSVGGAISGLENYAGKTGASIPGISDAQIKSVGIGAKYGGPGLSLAVTAWDVWNAETATQKCIAGISGTAGTAGGVVAGGLATSTGIGAVATVPIAMGGTWLAGWLGKEIGEMVCQ